jgi:hypothetical protein
MESVRDRKAVRVAVARIADIAGGGLLPGIG